MNKKYFFLLIVPGQLFAQAINYESGVCNSIVEGQVIAWACSVVSTELEPQPEPEPTPEPTPESAAAFSDDFASDGPLSGWQTYNASALPDVRAANGRYLANLTNNSGDRTLHYNGSQGRLDAVSARFPFTLVVLNVGIGLSPDNTQTAPEAPSRRYIFAGVQVHSPDPTEANSAHVVVGHRGSSSYTIEAKNTVNGDSEVHDLDAYAAPLGRIDLRIEGIQGPGSYHDNWLRVSFRQPGDTEWQLYNGDGILPASRRGTYRFTDEVFVGLITYAQGNTGVPFVGTADSFELYQ